MPPRSTTDRDEHSMGRECWDSSSCELKAQVQEPIEAPLATTTDDGNAAVADAAASVRAVHFAPTAKVRQITKLTKEQAKDIWFANEDFTKMKRSFGPTVQRMMNGTLTHEEAQGEDHCIRGLEYRTKDGARRRMKNKFNGIAAVLHEQDRQIFEEKEDPEALAAAYKEANFHCMIDAVALGTQDELDVKDYLATDNEPFYDAPENGEIRRRFKGRRGGGLKKNGSFHERSIRRIKRVFSGGRGKLRRSNTAPLPTPTPA